MRPKKYVISNEDALYGMIQCFFDHKKQQWYNGFVCSLEVNIIKWS